MSSNTRKRNRSQSPPKPNKASKHRSLDELDDLQVEFAKAAKRKEIASDTVDEFMAKFRGAGFSRAQIEALLTESTPAPKPKTSTPKVTAEVKEASKKSENAAPESPVASENAELVDVRDSSGSKDHTVAVADTAGAEVMQVEQEVSESAVPPATSHKSPPVETTSQLSRANKLEPSQQCCIDWFVDGNCKYGGRECQYSHEFQSRLKRHDKFRKKEKAGTLPEHTKRILEERKDKGKAEQRSTSTKEHTVTLGKPRASGAAEK